MKPTIKIGSYVISMQKMSKHEWELLLPFDTDNPEFVRGFEAGRIWERIKNDRTDWDAMVHGSNAEMIMRMCEVEDRNYRAEIVDDIYVQVFIS